MSPLFVCILIAVLITVVGYFGIWEWPAWPAFAVLYMVFGAGDPWLELSTSARAAVLVGLIAINIATWTAVVWALWKLVALCRGRLQPAHTPP
jgi:hypothetical protein